MAKLKYDPGDMIDLPDDPGPITPKDNHTAVQSNERTAVPSYDGNATPKPKRSKRSVEEVEGEPERVQRSLYATKATFDRIRRYAFDHDKPAQELYREGLLMVMKKYGIDEGTKLRDV